MEDLSSRYNNGSDVYDRCGMTQDNFILLALPIGGLPISQDWRDRMKLVHDQTCQVERIYWLIWCLKSVLGTPTLTRGKSNADLAAESAFSLPLLPIWLGTQQKIISLLENKKRHIFVSPSQSRGVPASHTVKHGDCINNIFGCN